MIAAVREDLDAGDRCAALVAGSDRARDLLALAAAHDVRAWMIEALRACPEFGGVPDDHLVEHARAVAAQVHIRSTLARLAPRLVRSGVRWAVIGGPVLAERIHGHPSMRTYTDLEILVDRRDLATALEVLGDHGFTEPDDRWAELDRIGAGAIPLGPGPCPAVLRWSLLATPAERRSFAIDTDVVLDRARIVDVDGCRVPTPDPVDTLLVLVLRAGLGGANKLIWLKDIDQAVRNQPFDRAEVDRRASELHVRAMTDVVLARVGAVLGAPVGGTSRLAATTSVVDQLPRPQIALTEGLYSGLWVSSVRVSARDTIRSGADQLRAAGARLWSAVPGSGVPGGHGVGDERLARSRYLANVAAGRHG
ncbi:MAG: nucleotidyltransferase family protein [Actinomycetota bacterium]|nr:nucleotidyltransferase family protein [Actinomycetota bacterium]